MSVVLRPAAARDIEAVLALWRLTDEHTGGRDSRAEIVMADDLSGGRRPDLEAPPVRVTPREADRRVVEAAEQPRGPDARDSGPDGCVPGWAMGFFDRLPPSQPEPEPEPPRPPRPVWMKPEAALPGIVADIVLLARTDDAAIAIIGLRAYVNGFGFTLSALLRRESRHGRMFDPGMQHRLSDRDEALPPEFLRLGVQFADGSVATNLNRPRYPSTGYTPSGPVLIADGGGGGGRRYDLRHWVWPLPPPGPVTFVCEWPAQGIRETYADIDAQLIVDAAGRAVELWPEDTGP